MNSYYSMIVDLSGKCCVVIGGGPVAERKVRALLKASAVVSVISPKFTHQLHNWVERGLLHGLMKEYEPAHLDGAFLVIAATNHPEVNYQIYHDGKQRNQLVNITDRPDLSNFIIPAVLRRGKLLISVSTSGASPSAALAIRNEIENNYGMDYEKFVDFLSDFRMKVKEIVKDAKKREQIFRDAAKLNILHMIRSGSFDSFKHDVMDRLQRDASQFTLRDFF